MEGEPGARVRVRPRQVRHERAVASAAGRSLLRGRARERLQLLRIVPLHGVRQPDLGVLRRDVAPVDERPHRHDARRHGRRRDLLPALGPRLRQHRLRLCALLARACRPRRFAGPLLPAARLGRRVARGAESRGHEAGVPARRAPGGRALDRFGAAGTRRRDRDARDARVGRALRRSLREGPRQAVLHVPPALRVHDAQGVHLARAGRGQPRGLAPGRRRGRADGARRDVRLQLRARGPELRQPDAGPRARVAHPGRKGLRRGSPRAASVGVHGGADLRGVRDVLPTATTTGGWEAASVSERASSGKGATSCASTTRTSGATR